MSCKCKDDIMRMKIVCKDDKYLPKYANAYDGCMDLKVAIDGEYTLLPGETKLFSTGIQVAVPAGYVMLVYPRSSTGTKLHCRLANTVGVIDTGYRDEVKLAIRNFGIDEVILKDGDRVAQFMLVSRPELELQVVEDNEEFRQGDRHGGFGSTGR